MIFCPAVAAPAFFLQPGAGTAGDNTDELRYRLKNPFCRIAYKNFGVKTDFAIMLCTKIGVCQSAIKRNKGHAWQALSKSFLTAWAFEKDLCSRLL